MAEVRLESVSKSFGSDIAVKDVTMTIPDGAFVVLLGPTGAGKTTTLYSALDLLRSEESNIVTVEDPVEYQLEGINQIQVQTLVGLSFARALAGVINILDPEVIVLGGGLSRARRLYRNLPALLRRYVFSDTLETRLCAPLHGDSSGVRGAARLWGAAD